MSDQTPPVVDQKPHIDYEQCGEMLLLAVKVLNAMDGLTAFYEAMPMSTRTFAKRLLSGSFDALKTAMNDIRPVSDEERVRACPIHGDS